MRLRELAASRVRFGYRRLTVLLKREGYLRRKLGGEGKGVIPGNVERPWHSSPVSGLVSCS